MDERPGRIDPFAVVVEVRADDDGADHAIGGGRNYHGLFDDGRELDFQVRGALGEESGGMGVAIDRGVVGDSVFLGDDFGAAPVEKFAFDFGALGMAADGAFAVVTVAPAVRIRPPGTPDSGGRTLPG
jgi:hypothetical protein